MTESERLSQLETEMVAVKAHQETLAEQVRTCQAQVAQVSETLRVGATKLGKEPLEARRPELGKESHDPKLGKEPHDTKK